MKRGKRAAKLLSLLFAASLLLGALSGVSLAAPAARGNQNYLGNQGDLLETPLISLQLGAVEARDWLENQLLLQKNGLTGNMHTFRNYNAATSAWLGAAGGENWEKGTYFLRGLVALAYALDDAALKAEAQQWIDWSLNSQQANGFFGPPENSWWSRMPFLMALRDYYEANEAKGIIDARVLPFMEKYFRYQLAELPTRPLSNWADARGGDNIDSVYWLYNRLYDADAPQNTKWLLDLGVMLKQQSYDWTTWYNDTTTRQHVVNTTQGMKLPAVYYQYDKTAPYKNALKNGILNMNIDHGRIDTLPNSDELARDNLPTRGTELCAIVEGLLSTEISQRILGEGWLGDRMEMLAYNSLPAAFTPDFTGQVYYIMQNQVSITLGNHEHYSSTDYGDSVMFGAPAGFECCFPNCHMGWPKFVQNMWMATKDNGLAVVAYGPNHVTAKVADGKTAKFLQETEYPFKEDVKLTYGGDTAAFELRLRIPEWAVSPVVSVNGTAQQGVTNGQFYTVTRTWQSGDVVTLKFPSKIKTSSWYNDSVAVEKGALIFGLKIKEDWRLYNSNDSRQNTSPIREDFPLREVYAASAWNYGLIFDKNNPDASFEIEYPDSMPLQPFSTDSPPVTLKAKGQMLPEWVLDGNLAGMTPYGPQAYDASRVRDIELIPFGSARLKITQFPRIGDAAANIRTDGNAINHNGVAYTEFKNVMVPAAEEYTLKVSGSGSGTVLINNKATAAVNLASGTDTVTGLRSKLSGSFQFREGQYNNLRFSDSLQISAIEIVPVTRTAQTIKVTSAKQTENAIMIISNLTATETPYRIQYGAAPGVYTMTSRGFSSSTAVISGVDTSKTHYARIIASIDGVETASSEIVLAPYKPDGDLEPNPNVPNARYDGFVSGAMSVWKKFDPENQINIQDIDGKPRLDIGRSTQVKAVLDGLPGCYDWVDFVAEAEISVDNVSFNNGGMMFRATGISNGPDEYMGYYAGFGKIGNDSGVIVGFANGGWNELYRKVLPIVPGQKYMLKVVTFGENIAVYLDGVLITTIKDTRFVKGTLGFRSYWESFKVYDVKVRPVVKADLDVFKPVPPEPDPSTSPTFSENFDDPAVSNPRWTKVGADTSIMNIADGKFNFGRSTDVKALTGQETWQDFVYEADIALESGSTYNSGLIFRVKQAAPGANSYYGYYFGINSVGYEIGRASNNWVPLGSGACALSPAGQPNRLKAVVYGKEMLFYVNGNLVFSATDATHTAGKLGFRGYFRAFTADNVNVRPLTQEEKDAIDNPPVGTFNVTATSGYDSLYLKFPKYSNANSYKVQFGRAPGQYTDEFVDIMYIPNAYAFDKVAVSSLGGGDFYARMVALKDGREIGFSNEVKISTGYLEGTQADRTKLDAAVALAGNTDVSAYTATSVGRLASALAWADGLGSSANQMALSLGKNLILISLAKQNSKDYAYPEPTGLAASIDISDGGATSFATYTVDNRTAASCSAYYILAVYDSLGRLDSVKQQPVQVAAGAKSQFTFDVKLPAGYTGQAFIWNASGFVPLCAPGAIR